MIEDKNFLNSQQKDFIENFILKNRFPYYIQPYTLEEDTIPILAHTCKRRNEEWNTPNKEVFINILNSFCSKNKIKYKDIIRCSVNLTFYTGVDAAGIHVDHPGKKHSQLIIYCNDPEDKKSFTVICNKNKKQIKKIKPEQFKGIYFGDNPHYHFYPKKGFRVVLVYTFN